MSETSGEPAGEQPPSYPPPAPQTYGQEAYGQQPYAQQPPPPAAWPPPPPTQPYPQAPYGQSYGQPQYAAPSYPGYALPDDRGATTALVLGIVGLAAGFMLCGLGFLVSPFALFFGLASKRRIDASGGQLGGRGNAQAGFILGILGTILLVLAIIGVIVFIVLVAIGVSHDSGSFNSGTNA